jgi:hypothetical protein
MWPQPLGPQAPRAQGFPDGSCRAPPSFHPCLSIGGGWRTTQSSQVATAERLLHETLASIGRNILHPISVSLRKKEQNLPVRLWLPSSPLTPSLLNFYPFASAWNRFNRNKIDAITCYCNYMRLVGRRSKLSSSNRGSQFAMSF